MDKRHFLIGLAAFGMSGCSLFNKPSKVPVVRDGFIVKPVPVAQGNMTSFLPEGDTIYLSGSINADTVKGFEAVRTAHPEAKRLVFLEADGVAGSAEAMGFGRAVRSAGFNTHLRNDSVISGGAIDAFLGGAQRTLEDGAVVGVVSSTDVEAHKTFASEMTGGDGYARFAQQFGRKRRPRPMTIAEIGAMGIMSANVGNIVEVIN